MKLPLIWLKDYIEINKTHKDIAESFTSLGLMLDKPMQGDVLDLEHRMDRADWLSIIGCARDLAAFEGVSLKFPELHTNKGKNPEKNQIINIKVECPDLVHRFNTRVFRGIKVKESPKWLKERLEAYGMPSINNIVDITNFVMVELGQPMHAQDISKMEKPEIVIRRAKKGEKVKTLLGETIELDTEVFVLTQNNKPTVIGGIVGGEATGVDESTTDIVLDAGNYNQVNIRKNSRKLKIQNETVLRYDKFLHPQLTEIALQRATKLILELAGGTYYENIDYYPKPLGLKQMELRMSRVSQIGGIEIDITKAEKILKALEYKVTNVDKKKNTISLEVPYFRTDVEVEDDLVADVLRINNYNNIPIEVISFAPPREITPVIYNFEERLRNVCSNLGLHEHITDPIVDKDENNRNQVVLENSLNADKTALRTSIYETLHNVLDIYFKNGFQEANIFEIGMTYQKNGSGTKLEDYSEQREISVIIESQDLDLLDNSKKVKSVLSGFLKELGIKAKYEKDKDTNSANILNSKNEKLGFITYNSFTFYTEKLLNEPKTNLRVKQEQMNVTTQDISLVLDTKQSMGAIVYEIENFSDSILDVEVVDEYQDTSFGQNKKSVTLRIKFSEKDNELKEKITSHLVSKFNVVLRTLNL